jgi:RNA polymerase sigma factor (sigma-70 family)
MESEKLMKKIAKKYKITSNDVKKEIKVIRQLAFTDKILAAKKESILVSSLSFIVSSTIMKYKKYPNYEDLYQEGMYGLVKAIQNYNVDTTFDFFRYAMWWIKARIYRSIGKINLVRITGDVEESKRTFGVSDIATTDVSNNETPETVLIHNDEMAQLAKALDKLPKDHKELIQLRYGLIGNKELTLKELGQKFNLSNEGLRQLEKKILSRLKKDSILNE